MTSTLLSHSLLLKVSHVLAMFLMEYCGLRDPPGLNLSDGFGTGSFSFLDQTAPGCLGFLTATRKSVLASRINWEQAVQASRVA